MNTIKRYTKKSINVTEAQLRKRHAVLNDVETSGLTRET